MVIPASRLIDRLDAEIAAEGNPVQADCLRAEKAAYLAREGDSETAKSVLDEIRNSYRNSENVRVAAALNLSEGVLLHYSALDPRARDKFLRSLAYASSADIPSVEALSAAWLAQIEYLGCAAESAAKYIIRALRVGDGICPQAILRASMVAAMSFHLCDRFDLARNWYQRARLLATDLGDRQAVSALMHNSAWLHVCALRRGDAAARLSPAERKFIEAQVESSLHFDSVPGISGLSELQSLLAAFSASTKGDCKKAIEIYSGQTSNILAGKVNSMEFVFIADLAFCQARLGQAELAIQILDQIDYGALGKRQPDDRALTFQVIAEVYNTLGLTDFGNAFSGRAKEASTEYHQYQNRLMAALKHESLTETWLQ